MSNFDPDRFAEWLAEAFRRSKFKSYAELAKVAGLKRSTVSSLVAAKPQSATGRASQPRTETVIRLADALGLDADEVLLRAGHAPRNGSVHFTILDGFDELSPEDQNVAAAQIRSLIQIFRSREVPRSDNLEPARIAHLKDMGSTGDTRKKKTG